MRLGAKKSLLCKDGLADARLDSEPVNARIRQARLRQPLTDLDYNQLIAPTAIQRVESRIIAPSCCQGNVAQRNVAQ